MTGPIHIREALAPVLASIGIEDAPRRPRYWAEGPFVVSSSKRRMSVEIARQALDHLVEAAVVTHDELAEADFALVADMIRAIRAANAFTPPTPASAATAPMERAA